MLTDQPGKDAWPITGATFILMHKVQDKPANAASALKFFDWAYANGDKMAADLDYVPLPDSVKALVRKPWAESIKDAAGKPVVGEVKRAARPSRPRPSRPETPWPLHCPPPRTTAARMPRTAAARPAARHRDARRPGPTPLFSVLAHGAAWLTLALLAGIIVSLLIGAAPAIREYGLGFLWTSEWDPVQNQLRRPGDDLRHADDLADRAA